ncbi:MAG TPA: hypothetical protein VIJ28_08070 [Chloroflexota bacterium]|jgi:hypothetical protein
MACCLQRAKRMAIGPFLSHFEERMPLKFTDYPLHQTVTHRRCGGHFVAIFGGEEREPGTGRWLATFWVLIPLTTDELADMECTPTADLRARRQELVPHLRADQWLWLAEGADRGVAKWSPPLNNIRVIGTLPPSAWPSISEGLTAVGRGASVQGVFHDPLPR